MCLCDCGINLPSGLIVWAEQRDRRPCTQDSVGGLSVLLGLCLCLVYLSHSFHLSLLFIYKNSRTRSGNG